MKTIRNIAALSLVATLVAAGVLVRCSGGDDDAASTASKAFVFENPFGDATPGEWARYRYAGNQTMLLTVREVEPITGEVLIEEEYRNPELNSLISDDTLRLPPNHFLHGFDSSGAVIRSVTFEKVRVAGRDWNALRVDYLSRVQGPMSCWYSNEVPVTGLLKQVRQSQSGEEVVNAVLLDWAKEPVRPGAAPDAGEKKAAENE